MAGTQQGGHMRAPPAKHGSLAFSFQKAQRLNSKLISKLTELTQFSPTMEISLVGFYSKVPAPDLGDTSPGVSSALTELEFHQRRGMEHTAAPGQWAVKFYFSTNQNFKSPLAAYCVLFPD